MCNSDKNIENIALLIPIHPPHYIYIYTLLYKFKQTNINIDLFLVFSNKSDYNKFAMKDYIKPIIITDNIENKAIVTYKKFYGLQKLCLEKYEYIICCDSEIDIIDSNFTNTNIEDKIRQIFQNKIIYAGESSQWEHITREAAELFPEYYDCLKEKTDNFILYFWWSDLPVYRKSDIQPFLECININKITNFDYIIYQYYLILFHNFTIVNTTPITNIYWSLENLCTDDTQILKKLLNINYGFSWITKKMYDKSQYFLEAQGSFLIYHLDR